MGAVSAVRTIAVRMMVVVVMMMMMTAVRTVAIRMMVGMAVSGVPVRMMVMMVMMVMTVLKRVRRPAVRRVFPVLSDCRDPIADKQNQKKSAASDHEADSAGAQLFVRSPLHIVEHLAPNPDAESEHQRERGDKTEDDMVETPARVLVH